MSKNKNRNIMKPKKVNSLKSVPNKKPHIPGKLPIAAKHLISRLKIESGKKNIMEYSQIVHTLATKYNLSMEEIAIKTNICKSHIYNYKHIGNLPSEVQNLIQAGKIAPTIALGVIRNIRNEKEMIEAINKHIANAEFDKKTRKQKIEGSATQIRKKMVSRIGEMVSVGFDVERMPKSILKSIDKTLRQFQHQISA